MLFIYRILINLVFLLSPIIFIFRLFKKKENFYSFKYKIGLTQKKRNKGKLIWFHGASVGEIQSIIPVVEKYENSKEINQILITSNTLSSQKILNSYNFKKVTHQFFPIDSYYLISKFINYWKPSIALFIDSEIWPNVLIKLNENKIPIVLLNARITKKSFKRWIKIKDFAQFIFKKFEICLCSNKETVRYLKKFGANKIKYFGNLKYAQSENEKIKLNKKTLNFFHKKIIWCASSTHNSEEKFIGHVHLSLKKKIKNLVTIIIPRHIDRENEIMEQLYELNLKVHLHENKEKIDNKTDIYLVNSFGKTKSFYSLVNNVFLGGSLIKHGGQNPLEAVRYNCNILHGPNISNFTEIYRFLEEQKISKKINNLNQVINILSKNLISKKIKNNIKNKIKFIGQDILKKNMSEIQKLMK